MHTGSVARFAYEANKAESLYHPVFHFYVAAPSLEGLGRLTEATETYERVLAEPLPASAQPDLDNANQLATLSTVGFAVGGAGVVAGVVLLVVRKKAPVPSLSTGALVMPWVGPGTVGLAGKF